MRIGIYNKYLDTLGGGEKYVLTIASLLSDKGQVDIFWPENRKKAEKITGLDLSKVNFMADPFSRATGMFDKIKKINLTAKYDLFFYVTDGSLFFSMAKKSFLIVQVPERKMYRNSFLNRLKLKTWHIQLCYSEYVKRYIKEWWKINTAVLPPAVNVEDFFSGVKKNHILNVGRFFPSPHSKKQEVLIEVFKKMVDSGLKNWSLLFVGGVDKNGEDYLRKIKSLIGNYPIEIRTNIKYEELKKIYSQASLYWHATGFGENLEQSPEKAEHFGITTVEAMAAGCVPLVFPEGGQKEIVDDKIDGAYWETKGELAEKTNFLINNKSLLKKYSLTAQKKAQQYSLDIFRNNLLEIISSGS